jgi:hypothetical protein
VRTPLLPNDCGSVLVVHAESPTTLECGSENVTGLACKLTACGKNDVLAHD